LDYEDESILFLFLGSIRPYKGIFELIDVFRNIESPKARLLIVGNPANETTKSDLLNRCELDSRIKTHLQYVPDDEIQIYMNAADVAVFPYTDILTSGSVLLAMSFGKSIVVPRIGCISETLDAKGSFLYDPDDTNGLSAAMQTVLTSDLATMGRHNRANVESYDWKKIAQMTLSVYSKSVLSK
jgi:glycosyltransferase involved in cell wall biosynthesis